MAEQGAGGEVFLYFRGHPVVGEDHALRYHFVHFQGLEEDGRELKEWE